VRIEEGLEGVVRIEEELEEVVRTEEELEEVVGLLNASYKTLVRTLNIFVVTTTRGLLLNI
jgi:hypothetical protein